MQASRMLRILAVDDVADNLFLLQTVLEGEGYIVDLAENGRTALAKVEANPPDLVLLDIMMPDMTGYEVARRIRQEKQLFRLPIFLLTAHSEVEARHSLDVTVNAFIRKPVDFDDLLARIQTFRPSPEPAYLVDLQPSALPS